MKRASGVEFIVMRHGQSEADLANPKIFEGRLDTKLTSTGLRQARLAADWMGARLPPTRIISSPMARAAMTADAIAAHVGLEVEFFLEENSAVARRAAGSFRLR